MRPKERILFILCSVWISIVALTSAGIALSGGIRGVELAALTLFLTFGITVFTLQLIPGGILLSPLAGMALSFLRRTNLTVRPT
jgi:hypothetical protein